MTGIEQQAPVMAYGAWKNNAEMIRDAIVPLGYLQADWLVCDPTYGLGRFWTLWRPDSLMASDIDPEKSPAGRSLDATDLPYFEGQFDATVIDGPYKLNGTSTGEGPSASDAGFGVHVSARWQDRMQLIRDMITEGAKITKHRGYVLVKCQDQVCSGAKRFQTVDFANHGATVGLELVDMLHLPSYRPQPAGRAQKNSRQNYSTMLIMRKVSP